MLETRPELWQLDGLDSFSVLHHDTLLSLMPKLGDGVTLNSHCTQSRDGCFQNVIQIWAADYRISLK